METAVLAKNGCLIFKTFLSKQTQYLFINGNSYYGNHSFSALSKELFINIASNLYTTHIICTVTVHL